MKLCEVERAEARQEQQDVEEGRVVHDETWAQKQSIVASTTSPKEERTMRSKSNRWLSGVGVVVFAGGLVLANFGGGITSVQANDHAYKNPFKQIMTKLDQILAKLNGGSAPAPAGGAATQPLPHFTVLADYNNAAVRDNSTGLVWEQNPIATTSDWSSARSSCLNKNVGGMRGWRLPSVVELASLIDPSLPAPYVPAPMFTGVQPNSYWSATSYDVNTATSSKWNVNLADGLAGTSSRGTFLNVWCVRGAMQDSVY